MTRPIHLLTLVITLAVAGTAEGVDVVTDQLQHEFPLNPTGVVVIDNPVGNIEVTAGSEPKVIVKSNRVIRAANAAAVAEARQVVTRIVEGNNQVRIIRTVAPAFITPRWHAQVHYTVVIPRTANLKIRCSGQTQRIRVTQVAGEVVVNNLNGPVILENVAGPVRVDNTNGDVILSASAPVAANARLTSINGSIDVRTAPDAHFTWEGETVMGDARTTFPLRSGRYITQTRFRSSVNGSGKFTLVTETFNGNISLLPHGGNDSAARSVRSLVREMAGPALPDARVSPMLAPPGAQRDLQVPLVNGPLAHRAPLGNVRVDEVRGTAKIAIGGGEVILGTVYGHCEVISGGGPVTLNDVIGRLIARTEGGNITVQRAREGGRIATGGGTVQIQYSGGPVQLFSGGGDIIVRQAAGPVNAETRSGDITLVLDAALKTQRISAKTEKGNVVLSLPAGFGADVDAIVITADPAANSIRSDFPGLSIQREQVGGKTRIRATGKINGGGERLELHAHDGGVHINIDVPRVSPMLPH